MALNCKEKGETFNINDFIESFQNELPKGTLIIPSYTEYLKDGDTFNYNKSKPTTGALSNRVMKRKDFVRSEDPLHSVLVWGKFQKEISSLRSKSTFGKDSIFEFLKRNNTKMLFIDTSFQNSFTFIHYVEEQLDVKYRKFYPFSLKYIDGNGIVSIRKINFHSKKLGVESDARDIQKEFEKMNLLTSINFNGSKLLLINLAEAYPEIEKYITNGGKIYHLNIKVFLKQLAQLILGYKKPPF